MKIHNGYKDIETELLSYTKDIDDIAIRMCGLTYHHKDNFEAYKNTVDFIVKKLVENKTSPKIMEAAHCVFVFKNISRVNLARLTRDQVGAINSESGAVPNHDLISGTFISKYKKEVSIIKPLSIMNNKELNKQFDEIINKMNTFRQTVEQSGSIWAPDMRYLFPQGETISIAMEYNARQLAACCNKRILNVVGDEDNFTMRKAIVALKNKIERDFKNNDLSELSYKLWQNIIKNAIPKVQFIDELLGDQLCEGMKTRGDKLQTPVYDKYNCSLFYELINAYVCYPELLILENEKQMIENWIKNDSIAKEYYNQLLNKKNDTILGYVILQKYANGSNLYITYKDINGSWRSKDIKNARIFDTFEAAKDFLDSKYSYGGNFTIEKLPFI